MSDSARSFLYAALILFLSVFVGVSGYMVVEGYSMLDAVYMTMLLISTVGFSEVRPLSEGGKLFTSIYMVVNLGAYAYVISVISRYIFEGEFQKIFTTFIFNKKTKRLKNHIIVVGYGRTGAKTCLELIKSKRQFILIESNEEILKYLPKKPSFQIITDDASKEEVLHRAGIEQADSLIITLPDDAENMLICITAKGLNPNINIVARASEESAEKKLYRAGATKVVKPFALGGIHMAHIITQPHVIEFLEILTGVADQNLKLEEFTFEELKKEFHNKSIRELDIRKNTGATIIGLKSQKKGFMFDPNSDTIISEKDIMIVLGSEENLEKFESYFA
ncbi:MAG: potassium channel protein [Cyclobacteriaceae bacterium]|nr:potassium channel protein [Cyclobacteriaceae bacterium]